MACLTNYTVQCKDVASGETGCFFFDQEHWKATGEFKAVGPVFSDLYAFYAATDPGQRQGSYLVREEIK